MRFFQFLSNKLRDTLTLDQFRFLQLVAGIYCALVVGTSAAFGLLTPIMKDQFDLDQSSLTTISTIGFGFAFFAFPVGVLYDYLGPQVVILLATFMQASGFVGFALVFAGWLPGTVPIFTVCAVCTFWSTGFFDVGTLMTNLFTFPLNRGYVVAVQKTFMGLGATIFALAYEAFFRDKTVEYSFFVSISVLAVGGFGAIVVDLPPYKRRELGHESSRHVGERDDDIATDLHIWGYRASGGRFAIGFVLLALLGLLLSATSLGTALTDIPHWLIVWIAVFVGVLLLAFLLMVFPCVKVGARSNEELVENSTTKVEPKRENWASFIISLQTSELWLMWFNASMVLGACSIVSLNTPQIYTAVNNTVFSENANSLFVAVSGIGGALGRVVAGLLENWLAKNGQPVTELLPYPALISAFSLILFTFATPYGLFLPFFLNQFAFGAAWAIIVLACRQLYRTDVGTHYNFVISGPIVALVIFNRLIFGPLYDAEGTRQGTFPDCAGHVCFRATFFSLSVGNCLASVAMIVVHRKWLLHYFEPSIEEEHTSQETTPSRHRHRGVLTKGAGLLFLQKTSEVVGGVPQKISSFIARAQERAESVQFLRFLLMVLAVGTMLFSTLEFDLGFTGNEKCWIMLGLTVIAEAVIFKIHLLNAVKGRTGLIITDLPAMLFEMLLWLVQQLPSTSDDRYSDFWDLFVVLRLYSVLEFFRIAAVKRGVFYRVLTTLAGPFMSSFFYFRMVMRKHQYTMPLALFFLFSIFISVLFGHVEKVDLWDSFYFVIVTAGTIGYGDITPQTRIGQTLVFIAWITGVTWVGYFVVQVHEGLQFSETERRLFILFEIRRLHDEGVDAAARTLQRWFRYIVSKKKSNALVATLRAYQAFSCLKNFGHQRRKMRNFVVNNGGAREMHNIFCGVVTDRSDQAELQQTIDRVTSRRPSVLATESLPSPIPPGAGASFNTEIIEQRLATLEGKVNSICTALKKVNLQRLREEIKDAMNVPGQREEELAQ